MPTPNHCTQCEGSLEPRTLIHRQAWGEDLYEFEDVPALVCQHCGEAWLEAETGQLMESIIRQQPQPKWYHQVPVFSLTEFST